MSKQSNATDEKEVVRRIGGADPYENFASCHVPSDRVTAVREDGFLAGYHDEDPALAETIAKSTEYERSLQLESLRAEVAVLEHRAKHQEEERAATEKAEKDANDKQVAAEKRAQEVPDPETSWVVTAMYAVLYLSAGAFFLLGEMALSRITIGPVFGLPTNGPDAWEGWVFAISLALLAIPFKIACDELVLGRRRSGKDPSRRRGMFWLVAGTLAIGSAALTGYVRWIHMLTEGQIALLPADALIPPLFAEFPRTTGTALVLVTVVFAVSGGLCLSIGSHRLNELLLGTGRTARSTWTGMGRHRTTRSTRRRHESAKQAAVAAGRELAEAKAKVEATNERFDALRDYLVSLYTAGYVSGLRARRTDANGSDYAQVGQDAATAFRQGYGYTPVSTDGSLDPNAVGVGLALPTTPLHERARLYLDNNVFH